jgi:hypothetical protein
MLEMSVAAHIAPIVSAFRRRGVSHPRWWACSQVLNPVAAEAAAIAHPTHMGSHDTPLRARQDSNLRPLAPEARRRGSERGVEMALESQGPKRVARADTRRFGRFPVGLGHEEGAVAQTRQAAGQRRSASKKRSTRHCPASEDAHLARMWPKRPVAELREIATCRRVRSTALS